MIGIRRTATFIAAIRNVRLTSFRDIQSITTMVCNGSRAVVAWLCEECLRRADSGLTAVAGEGPKCANSGHSTASRFSAQRVQLEGPSKKHLDRLLKAPGRSDPDGRRACGPTASGICDPPRQSAGR